MKKHRLVINGKNFNERGLDLAVNPFTGRVVGQVVLVPEVKDLLEDKFEPEEEITEEITVNLKH